MSDIQSVKRAFDILKAVSANPNGVSLTEVATRVELPKSTVSRMLTTLTKLGVVERVREREGFKIGNELLAIASHAGFPTSIHSVARPFMQQLSQATGETLTLCVPDGDAALYVDQVNSVRVLQVHDWINQRIPLHACSDGKLFLAHLTDAQVEHYLKKPLQKFTRTTLTTAAGLRKEVALIRKKGYAWTNGEYDPDVVGLAVPIKDSDGILIASLCIFGAAFRWLPEAKSGRLIQLAKDAAVKIGIRLKTLNGNVASSR